MSSENNKQSLLQRILEKACKGTSVTTRELFVELTQDDLASVKNGELTAEDLRLLVLDLADSKENAQLYRVKGKDFEPLESN